MSHCQRWVFLVGCYLVPLAGCEAIDVWRMPESTPEQYEKGLIVFYPGTANLHMEGIGFYYAFREAGLDLAMEERQWSGYLETVFNPPGVQEKITAAARIEAERIAEYIRAHPTAPVTLISYSGGAVFAPQVAGFMPEGTYVDRVILMSPGVAKSFDLSAALEKTPQGIINYWSPAENGPVLVSRIFGLSDGTNLDPACTFGFDIEHPRLMEVSWTPEMEALGNRGEHLDFLVNLPWIKQYVVPWIITEKSPAP